MPRPSAARGWHRRWMGGLREMLDAWAVGFGVLALGIVVALFWTGSLSQDATTAVMRDGRKASVANELALDLMTYQRLSNLIAIARVPEPELDEMRREHLDAMDRRLAVAVELARDGEERRLTETARDRLNEYVAARWRLDAAGLAFPELVQRTRPYFDRALASLHGLRNRYELAVKNAHAEIQRLNLLSKLAGTGAAALLALAIVALLLGVRRHLVTPMLELRATIARFCRGDVSARASPTTFREMNDVVEAFNEGADELTRARQGQVIRLAGIAHDLRNPLSALKMAASVVTWEPNEERRAATQALMERQIDRLTRMVDDLLDATLIEAGGLELHLEEMDLRNAAVQVVELYQPATPTHRLSLILPDGAVLVCADPLRIEQVISNLVSNAIKYSPTGRVVVIRIGADETRATLEVSDRGIGIAKEDLDRLFLPFLRQSKDVARGAGLGLSVVRRIVEAHHGTIEVESALGEGSTFRLRLPLSDRVRPEAAAPG